MKIHFLRDKTYLIYSEDGKYLVNPYFGEQDTQLPISVKEILKDLAGVILTDDFEPDKETVRQIKQKGIRFCDKKDITSAELLKAIDLFGSLQYFPLNGEIILQEKLSC